MKTFLNKLDRIAEKMVTQLDDQMQDTVMQVLTGEVFTHGTTPDHSTSQIVTGQKLVPQTTPRGGEPVVNPHRKSTNTGGVPVLRKATES